MAKASKKLTIVSLLVLPAILGGCFLAPQGQNTNTNVILNPPKADEESGEIDTSGWKTYRNEEYGFEFRYPGKENINIKSGSDQYGIDPGGFSYFFGVEQNGIRIIPIKQEASFDVESLLIQHVTTDLYRTNIHNGQYLSINGNNAVQFDTKENIGVDFKPSGGGSASSLVEKDMRLVFIQGPDRLVLSFFPLPEKYDPSFSDIYTLIISSLKFID